MKIVDPDEITTLIANKHYQALNFCTARATIRHLMAKRVLGLDATGNAYSWDGVDINNYPTIKANPFNWQARNLQFFDDQPALRSGGSEGTTIEWPIPTTIICTTYWGYKPRNNETVNIRKLYKYYKGICQLCLKWGPLSEMNIDHAHPKFLGGTSHDFNLVLAHRQCNRVKGHESPYYNAAGQEVKGKPILKIGVMVPDIPIRDDWKEFLYQ